MGIYEEATKAHGQAAYGVGAADQPIDESYLPPMDEASFNAIWDGYGQQPATALGLDPGPGSAPSVYGADSRGAAIHQEEMGGTTGGVRGKIVRAAKAMVGLPYVWGGANAQTGVDCSGLVMLAYQAAGIELPRVSYQQARAGVSISARQAQAGDIVSFDNSARNNGADHVAIYLGGGMMLEAARPGVPVRIRKLGSNEGASFTRVV